MKNALFFKKHSLGLLGPRALSCLPLCGAREGELDDLLEPHAFRARFQSELDAFIGEKTRHVVQLATSQNIEFLCNYPRRLAIGGKRVRPYVAYLMFRALGGRGEERALKLLVSLELFHLFCLVHDDIIDNGTQRHGLPTVQCAVALRLAGKPDAARLAKAQAILLGDMIFAWAQEAFYSNRDFEAALLEAARPYFVRMIDEVVLGEMLDVDLMARADATGAEIQQKMLLKTASYTFIRPLQIGAALAGQGAQTEKFCHDFGLAVGLAFQIQDDLLDLIGTPQATKKTLFSDLREGQHTYFTQYIFECGTKAEREQLRAWLGTDISLEEQPRVRQLFEESGALKQGCSDIARHLQRAHQLLETSPMPPKYRGAFAVLLSRLENRPS